MLQVCIRAIWCQGLLLKSGRLYATFGTKNQDTFFRAIIQGAFLVENCKNDGFTKMSVES